MERIERFARAAQALCFTVLEAPEQSLACRVMALAAVVPEVFAASTELPPRRPTAPPPLGPGAPGWPGLGELDRAAQLVSAFDPGSLQERSLSEALLEVDRWLIAGVLRWKEGDPAGAVEIWAAGRSVWLPSLGFVLVATAEAAERFAPEAPRQERGPAVAEIVGLKAGGSAQVVPGPLTPEPPVVGVLGLRFEAIGLGAWVQEVHPKGPAAGKLERGDVVLAVDGVTLEEVDAELVAQRLVGPVGRVKRYQVYREGETLEVSMAPVAKERLS